ncbi:hypothetical protein KDW_19110 [Dictyobacter vulcani]|uniref:DUF2795 domain-containing protein n=1 Tax=Dictyobacter vulcani TaxID=2607529 RepID=A0A5J4KNS4_9CHLR|nr:DUF2795 domain-containing protein [Dictyobacter vulcani]GER87749.1 hypothetical protein KDW_19110 [Dictyobacter vulcani]
MNISNGQVDQLLNSLPYQLTKTKLVEIARQRGVNDQVISMMDKLPDKKFNSADEVKSAVSGIGNLGGFKL